MNTEERLIPAINPTDTPVPGTACDQLFANKSIYRTVVHAINLSGRADFWHDPLEHGVADDKTNALIAALGSHVNNPHLMITFVAALAEAHGVTVECRDTTTPRTKFFTTPHEWRNRLDTVCEVIGNKYNHTNDPAIIKWEQVPETRPAY